VEHGAQIDAKNKVGWTPLTLARGVFVSNTLKVFPDIAAYIEKTLIARGMPVEAPRPAPAAPVAGQ